MMKIGVAGLTHLGLVTSIGIAAKGFDVIGFDPNRGLVDELNCGNLPINEPGLSDLLLEARRKISFTADCSRLGACEVIFLACDVPTDARNISQLSLVIALFEEVRRFASRGSTIVVHCQVPPGFTRQLADNLKSMRSSSEPQSYTLYYQVETLIFGRAVERVMQPERYIIGCEFPETPLPAPYRAVLESFGCPILNLRYESAELAKIAINAFLLSSIVTTSALAEICEEIGGEWEEVAGALRLDKRIGKHAYLKPGLGVAGGNLERDLVTMQQLSWEHGTDGRIFDAWRANLDYRRQWVLRTLNSQVICKTSRPVIAIWGLSYKPDTHSVKNSPSLELTGLLRDFSLRVCDPVVELDRAEFSWLTQHESALECCAESDVLILMTPWSEFCEIDLKLVADTMKGRVVIDPHGALDRRRCKELGLDYYCLGSASKKWQ